MKKKNGWRLLAISGAVLIAASIYMYTYPWHTYLHMIRFSGAGLLLYSIFLVVAASTARPYAREKEWFVTESILNTFFGLLFLFNPFLIFLAFPILIGAWAVCWGLLRTAFAFAIRRYTRQWPFVATIGLFSMLFGLLLIYQPFNRASSITILIATFTLLTGLLNLLDAARLQKTHQPPAMFL